MFVVVLWLFCPQQLSVPLLCSWSRFIQNLKALPNSLQILFLLHLACCAPA